MDSFGDLTKLPKDVRIMTLTRVKSIYDLFTIGRTNMDMRQFMKKHNVFPKWFCYNLNVPEEDFGQLQAICNAVLHGLDIVRNECFILISNEEGMQCLLRFRSEPFKIMFQTNELKNPKELLKISTLEVVDPNGRDGNYNSTEDVWPYDESFASGILKFLSVAFHIVTKNNLQMKLRVQPRTRDFFPNLSLCQIHRPFDLLSLLTALKYASKKSKRYDAKHSAYIEKMGLKPSRHVDEYFTQILAKLKDGSLRVVDLSTSGKKRIIRNRINEGF